MNFGSQRGFSFKNEELPVISGFTAISLERDLTDFTTYSLVFDPAYVIAYKAKIANVQELVQPYSETVEGKLITERTEATLREMISMVNYLEGYVNLASGTIPMNPADFGLILLRKSVRSRDLEAVLSHIRPVANNMERYHAELSAVGMTEALSTKFNQAGVSLADDKNKRYIMVSSRSALVQSNIAQLNDLYDQMNEICSVGKIIYKQTDKAKQNDYTIAFLLKQVHRTFKTTGDTPEPPAKPAEE